MKKIFLWWFTLIIILAVSFFIYYKLGFISNKDTCFTKGIAVVKMEIANTNLLYLTYINSVGDRKRIVLEKSGLGAKIIILELNTNEAAIKIPHQKIPYLKLLFKNSPLLWGKFLSFIEKEGEDILSEFFPGAKFDKKIYLF